jgi:hypothetical protein
MTTASKFSMYFICLLDLIAFLFTSTTHAQEPADPDSIIGRVVCGYQGWFNCNGDGSPINSWFHWSGNPMPAPGNLSFEIYPDVSIYDSPVLFQTGFANTGSGQPSRLFSSYKQTVTDTHFELMQTHGIDGVALQRFISEVISTDHHFKENRDTIASQVRNSAETYSRLFYITYDLSGLMEVTGLTDEQKYNKIKSDWQYSITDSLSLTSSPMYAHQDGKYVVELWGIGFTHVIGNATLALDLISWFKDQECYVIGGVPTNWRTGTGDSRPGYSDVYKAFDMISPWTVGRFSGLSGADDYKDDYLVPDLAYCNTYGMTYMPVVFPGFAWSNWVPGYAQNQIPRIRGEFMWRQVYNIESLSIPSVYMAMFDEYDEGTALLSMADSYFMIPTNQYFLTSSADGTYISSDFYLRLTGKATKVIKGIDPVTSNVPIPYSSWPVYFRTSVEEKTDASPSWTSTTEAKINVSNYGSNSGNPTCAVNSSNPHKGIFSIRAQGRDKSAATSYAYFKVFDVDIPVVSNTHLHFWSYPTSDLGRYVSVDMVMTDGTTLRDCGAVDTDGLSMHPATGRGTVNTWTKTTSVIGAWLNGKTIDRILIAYDHAEGTGDFRAYFDDIAIDTGMAALPCTWTGAYNYSWFSASNWSNDAVPTASTDVFISAGTPYMPVIDATGAVCRNISIGGGSSITVNPTYSISVYGDWQSHDNLHMPDNSTVIFKGGSNTIIDGYTYFYNLVIDKTNSANTLTDEDEFYPGTSFEVSNDLTINSGRLIINGSDWDYFIGNNITIGSFGTLASNHWFPLHVKGDWTNNGGNYIPGNCQVMFDGSGTQTIAGSINTLFHNLLFEGNTIEITGTTGISVNGSLIVSPGTVLNVDGSSTLYIGGGSGTRPVPE